MVSHLLYQCQKLVTDDSVWSIPMGRFNICIVSHVGLSSQKLSRCFGPGESLPTPRQISSRRCNMIQPHPYSKKHLKRAYILWVLWFWCPPFGSSNVSWKKTWGTGPPSFDKSHTVLLITPFYPGHIQAKNPLLLVLYPHTMDIEEILHQLKTMFCPTRIHSMYIYIYIYVGFQSSFCRSLKPIHENNIYVYIYHIIFIYIYIYIILLYYILCYIYCI